MNFLKFSLSLIVFIFSLHSYLFCEDPLSPVLTSDTGLFPGISSERKLDILDKGKPGTIGKGEIVGRVFSDIPNSLPTNIFDGNTDVSLESLEKINIAIDVAIRAHIENNNLVPEHLRNIADKTLDNLLALKNIPSRHLHLFNAINNSDEDYLLGFNLRDKIGLSFEMTKSFYSLSINQLAQYIYHECIPESGGMILAEDNGKKLYKILQSIIFGETEVFAMERNIRCFISEDFPSIEYIARDVYKIDGRARVIAFSKNGEYFITATENRIMYIYKENSSGGYSIFQTISRGITEDDDAIKYPVEKSNPILKSMINMFMGEIGSIDIDSDGKGFFVACSDGYVYRYFKRLDGKFILLEKYNLAPKFTRNIRVSEDRTTLFASSRDTGIYKRKNREFVKQQELDDKYVIYTFEISKDGKNLFVGTFPSGFIHFSYESKTGKYEERKTYETEGAISKIKLSPDEKFLVWSDGSGAFFLYSFDGKNLEFIDKAGSRDFSGPVLDMCFNSEKRILTIVGTYDYFTEYMYGKSGLVLLESVLIPMKNIMSKLAISPKDGKSLVLGSSSIVAKEKSITFLTRKVHDSLNDGRAVKSSSKVDNVISLFPTRIFENKENNSEEVELGGNRPTKDDGYSHERYMAKQFKYNLMTLLNRDVNKTYLLAIDMDVAKGEKVLLIQLLRVIEMLVEMKNSDGNLLFPNLKVIRKSASSGKLLEEVENERTNINKENMIFITTEENMQNKIFSSFEESSWITAIDNSRFDTLFTPYMPIMESITLSLLAMNNADAKTIAEVYNSISNKMLSIKEITLMLEKKTLHILPKIRSIEFDELKEIYEALRKIYLAA